MSDTKFKRSWTRSRISVEEDEAIHEWAEKRAIKDAQAQGLIKHANDIMGIYANQAFLNSRHNFYYEQELERLYHDLTSSTNQAGHYEKTE